MFEEPALRSDNARFLVARRMAGQAPMISNESQKSPKGSTAPEALMSSQPAPLLGVFGDAEASPDLRCRLPRR